MNDHDEYKRYHGEKSGYVITLGDTHPIICFIWRIPHCISIVENQDSHPILKLNSLSLFRARTYDLGSNIKSWPYYSKTDIDQVSEKVATASRISNFLKELCLCFVSPHSHLFSPQSPSIRFSSLLVGCKRTSGAPRGPHLAKDDDAFDRSAFDQVGHLLILESASPSISSFPPFPGVSFSIYFNGFFYNSSLNIRVLQN